MKLLSIECSSKEISVAATNGDHTALIDSAKYAGSNGSGDRKGTSALLAPMVQSVLGQVELTPDQLELIAVTKGPGSFTGLRVGIVTARTLAYVTGAKLAGVNTLEAVALKTARETNAAPDTRINVVVNAQRSQLFGGRYRCTGNGVEVEGEMKLYDREAWLSSIARGEIATGPGLTPLLESLKTLEGVSVAPESCRLPDVSVVAEIGLASAAESADAVWNLEPIYFRPSYADEKVASGKS